MPIDVWRISMRISDAAAASNEIVIQYNTMAMQCNEMHWIHFNGIFVTGLVSAYLFVCFFFLLFSRLVVCFVFIVHLLCYSIDVDICEMCQFSLPQSWLSLVRFGLVDEFAVYAVYRMNYTNQTTMPHYFRSQVYFYEKVPKFKLLSSICVWSDFIRPSPIDRPNDRSADHCIGRYSFCIIILIRWLRIMLKMVEKLLLKSIQCVYSNFSSLYIIIGNSNLFYEWWGDEPMFHEIYALLL